MLDPALTRSCFRSIAIFLNGGRRAGLRSQQALIMAVRAGVVTRVCGRLGLLFSSEKREVSEMK